MIYEYLKKYDSQFYGGRISWPNNVFYKVTDSEILEAEELLGYRFPDQLRGFYQAIGTGRLVCSNHRPDEYDFGGTNEILHPMVVARFTKGIYEWEGQDRWISEDVYEMLNPNDMPFFEIGDSSGFMILKPFSDTPNAVYLDSGDILIEESFEKFIWKLYYDDPGYYGNIIDAHYKNH